MRGSMGWVIEVARAGCVGKGGELTLGFKWKCNRVISKCLKVLIYNCIMKQGLEETVSNT